MNEQINKPAEDKQIPLDLKGGSPVENELLTAPSLGSSIPNEKAPSRSTQQALKQRNKRIKRIPLDKQRSLIFEQDPKFHYREVIDEGGRIEKFKLAGYELDEKPDGEKESRSKDASNLGKYRNRVVGTTDTGQEIRAWIMRIPIEWYEEDQKAKQDAIDRKMRACKHSVHGISKENTCGEIKIDSQLV